MLDFNDLSTCIIEILNTGIVDNLTCISNWIFTPFTGWIIVISQKYVLVIDVVNEANLITDTIKCKLPLEWCRFIQERANSKFDSKGVLSVVVDNRYWEVSISTCH